MSLTRNSLMISHHPERQSMIIDASIANISTMQNRSLFHAVAKKCLAINGFNAAALMKDGVSSRTLIVNRSATIPLDNKRKRQK